MTCIAEQLAALDWERIGSQLDEQGHAHLPGLLPATLIRLLSDCQPSIPGETNNVATTAAEPLRTRWLGEPLFEPLQQLRASMYERLQPIATRWAEMENSHRHPSHAADTAHSQLTSSTSHAGGVPPAVNTPQNDQAQGQLSLDPHHLAAPDKLLPASRPQENEPLSRLQYLSAGSDQPLWQSTSSCAFPFALLARLNAPRQDFAGGEWVFIEQRPRMQSRPMVIQAQQGDAVIFSTGRRPVRSSSGYTQANLKQGISRVHSGISINVLLHFQPLPIHRA